MVHYKWVALSNTTLGVLMASINANITLISLPAIFNGIGLNPLAPGAFQYLLWLLFGYSIVTATLLVTFGRLSDMFGRVRLYNLGFAIFTFGSILLFLTPNTGTLGALELVIFRIVQAVGGAFLFSNSAAILTDAFGHNERGKALGINQVAALVGSLVGLILGGVLSVIDWRLVFLVSVPVGIVGTVWSYKKLRELSVRKKDQKLDVAGNLLFAAGLTLLLVGLTYGLLPYGTSTMGWSSPFVIVTMVLGALMLIVFPFVEMRVKDPMFKLELFKIRMFSAGNAASTLSSIGRGGVFIILIILLQGIWLPLHGYSFSSTPFWSGIFITPMLVGFVVMGPLSGWLSDKYGARGLATMGMILSAVAFVLLASLPYNFNYIEFGSILLLMGMGSGMFASPNTASIMNSVPPENRGAASGMMATLRNSGTTASIGIFFTIIIISLSASLPLALSSALVKAGAPSVASAFQHVPPTEALFAAFLGYNPVSTVLSQLPNATRMSIPNSTVSYITSNTWFPNAIAPAFSKALSLSFYIGAALSIIAAAASLLRGKRYIHGENAEKGLEGKIAMEEASDEERIRREEEMLDRDGKKRRG